MAYTPPPEPGTPGSTAQMTMPILRRILGEKINRMEEDIDRTAEALRASAQRTTLNPRALKSTAEEMNALQAKLEVLQELQNICRLREE